MPVYQLHCPNCEHRFTGMVFQGARLPELWICPQCNSENAQRVESCPPMAHPLEASHGSGCPCCGGGGSEHPHHFIESNPS